MAEFKTPKSLERHLMNVIDDVIRNEVQQTIIEIWLAVQEERVYATYEPTDYTRRGSQGGLADPENIEFVDIQKFKNELQYVLENITKGAGDVLGEKINALIEGKDGFAGDPYAGMPARPYTQEAIEIINSHPTAMRSALTRGFARHKLSITVN